ncbi:excisionase family DNA binding protein [Oxalobacteraceae bacterium GrIS 2.11]
MANTTHSQLIRSAEVVKRMGISYTTLWRLVKAHKIPPPRKIGRLNRWLESDIENYIVRPTNETTNS